MGASPPACIGGHWVCGAIRSHGEGEFGASGAAGPWGPWKHRGFSTRLHLFLGTFSETFSPLPRCALADYSSLQRGCEEVAGETERPVPRLAGRVLLQQLLLAGPWLMSPGQERSGGGLGGCRRTSSPGAVMDGAQRASHCGPDMAREGGGREAGERRGLGALLGTQEAKNVF